MRWGFRVATDPRFGAGHLARCRALAAALDPEAILFADPGHRPVWPSDIVGEATADSAIRCVAALRDGTVQAVVADSYSIGEAAIDETAQAGFVAVFRDGSSYGSETLSIDPNPGFAAGRAVLGGPAYMPLPPLFADFHERASRTQKSRDGRLAVLIAFGARDSANRTLTALDGLMPDAERLSVSVAVGGSSPYADEIGRKVGDMKNARLLPAGQDLASAYEQFDLAIGAPGVSQFERACCGVPTILVAQNDRQVPLAQAWAQAGAAVTCAPEPTAIGVAVKKLMGEAPSLRAMRESGLALVDGKGAARLADALKDRAIRR